jgi:hypothetical protein
MACCRGTPGVAATRRRGGRTPPHPAYDREDNSKRSVVANSTLSSVHLALAEGSRRRFVSE